MSGAGRDGFFQAGGKLAANPLVETLSATRVRFEMKIQGAFCA